MRARTSEWFECKVRYSKTLEDGTNKKVKELYTVDALSFAESEGRIIDEMSHYISGDYEVTDIKKAAYSEIFFSNEETADRWYKVKMAYITLDEKTNKEKRQNVVYLVQAASVNGAVKNTDEMMKTSMADYTIVSVVETQIMDVIEHLTKEDAE